MNTSSSNGVLYIYEYIGKGDETSATDTGSVNVKLQFVFAHSCVNIICVLAPLTVLVFLFSSRKHFTFSVTIFRAL